MAIAGTNVSLNSAEGHDKITITEKVTSPYFSDGTGTLNAGSIISTSISDTNETYYVGISNNSTATTAEFHVSYGNYNGYGANKETNTVSETEAVYKQFASLLLVS